jgi:hypothetical protein
MFVCSHIKRVSFCETLLEKGFIMLTKYALTCYLSNVNPCYQSKCSLSLLLEVCMARYISNSVIYQKQSLPFVVGYIFFQNIGILSSLCLLCLFLII